MHPPSTGGVTLGECVAGQQRSCRDQEGRGGSEEAVPGPSVLELRRPWGFSPEARRGSQGASRAALGKSGLHALRRDIHRLWPEPPSPPCPAREMVISTLHPPGAQRAFKESRSKCFTLTVLSQSSPWGGAWGSSTLQPSCTFLSCVSILLILLLQLESMPSKRCPGIVFL